MLEREHYWQAREAQNEWESSLKEWQSTSFNSPEYDRALNYTRSAHRAADVYYQAFLDTKELHEWIAQQQEEAMQHRWNNETGVTQ